MHTSLKIYHRTLNFPDTNKPEASLLRETAHCLFVDLKCGEKHWRFHFPGKNPISDEKVLEENASMHPA